MPFGYGPQFDLAGSAQSKQKIKTGRRITIIVLTGVVVIAAAIISVVLLTSSEKPIAGPLPSPCALISQAALSKVSPELGPGKESQGQGATICRWVANPTAATSLELEVSLNLCNPRCQLGDQHQEYQGLVNAFSQDPDSIVPDHHTVSGLGDEATIIYGVSHDVGNGEGVLIIRLSNVVVEITYDGGNFNASKDKQDPLSQSQLESAVRQVAQVVLANPVFAQH